MLGPEPVSRAVHLGTGAPPGFDGTIDIGTKATASLPVAPQ